MTQTTSFEKKVVKIDFKAIKQGILLALLIGGLFLFSGEVLGKEINWYSPTSADSENGECIGSTCWCYYDGCSNVWDDNLETLTRDTYFAGWGKYLYLYRSGEADRIRFNALYDATNTNTMSIDIFYNGGWNNIYNSTYPDHTWVEVEFPEGTKNVTKARVKIYTTVRYERKIYEFDFGSSYNFLSFDSGDLASTTAYIGDILTSMGGLFLLAVGLHVAFYVIRKIMSIFPM